MSTILPKEEITVKIFFNKKKNISGHLWRERFYSRVLDKLHLMVALRYVERGMGLQVLYGLGAEETA